jgi:hypothetical protein
VTLSVFEYNFEEPTCGPGVNFNACVKLKVPDQASWTRVGNTVTVNAEGITADCGFYDEEGMPRPANPLANKKIAAAITITCKKLSKDTNKCRNRYTSPDIIRRSRNYSYLEDCSVEKVGTITFDGVTRTFDSASFGKNRYKERSTTKAPPPKASG